jgi:hypothetical protein
MDQPAVDLSRFSESCPSCNAHEIRPLMQRNNFEEVREVGTAAVGVNRTSTTRKLRCEACSYEWEETVPSVWEETAPHEQSDG